MSETMQGPDWWLASDGKWYPPDLREATGESLERPEGAERPIGPDWWIAADGKWYPPALRSQAERPESRGAWLAMRYLGFVPEQSTEPHVRADLLQPLEVTVEELAPASSSQTDALPSFSPAAPAMSSTAPDEGALGPVPARRRTLSVEDLLGEPTSRSTAEPAASSTPEPPRSWAPEPPASWAPEPEGPSAVDASSDSEHPLPEQPADRGWSLAVRSSEPGHPPEPVTPDADDTPADADVPASGTDPGETGWFDLPPEQRGSSPETVRRSRGPRHGRRRRWLGPG